ncbi:hypothetical protein N836_19255 [Leptolyngbya sp. Heron Island J]|uniref:hypothetical protein n=1 Tax=Leptolyngbya sp. Heron Island J TaxID=1385935 RepID=UPI0003B979BB|nr:hypothetical protein [Leptolyngbya sp. Heron Island J]ESA34011.1 hypothetical protein N836_19255 [Leptolyngbya sp. Heron Island J]
MGSDVLILTIYFLVVIYVLYQMALSVENALENKLRIDLNRTVLTEQLGQQLQQLPPDQKITAEIEDLEIEGKKLPPQLSLSVTSQINPKQTRKVVVKVGPMGKMPMAESLMALNVTIINTTSDAQIFIDWDKSSVTAGLARQTQRVVRSGIPISSDLSRSQVLSVINPGETFSTKVTGENRLSLNAETRTLTPGRALVNMQEVATKIALFMEDSAEDEEIPPVFAYSLGLMIGIRQITHDQTNHTTYLLLPFAFQAVLLPDEIAFPPLRWLLNRPRPATAREAFSALILGRPRL